MNKLNSGIDTLAGLYEEYKKSGCLEKDEAKHNAIMERNRKHNDEAKENRVFEWMDRTEDQGFRWGGLRGAKE